MSDGNGNLDEVVEVPASSFSFTQEPHFDDRGRVILVRSQTEDDFGELPARFVVSVPLEINVPNMRPPTVFRENVIIALPVDNLEDGFNILDEFLPDEVPKRLAEYQRRVEARLAQMGQQLIVPGGALPPGFMERLRKGIPPDGRGGGIIQP